MLDQAFKGQKYLFTQLNEQNNDALLTILSKAGVALVITVFNKDKSCEKLADKVRN